MKIGHITEEPIGYRYLIWRKQRFINGSTPRFPSRSDNPDPLAARIVTAIGNNRVVSATTAGIASNG
jgi:hypothetical protein